MKNYSKKTKSGDKVEVSCKNKNYKVGQKIDAWSGAKGKYLINSIEDAGDGYVKLHCTYVY